jgi:hypothetical protein
VKTNLAVSKLIESICNNLLKEKSNLEEIYGDLQAIRIIGQRSGIRNSVKLILQDCLQSILLKFKNECLSEGECQEMTDGLKNYRFRQSLPQHLQIIADQRSPLRYAIIGPNLMTNYYKLFIYVQLQKNRHPKNGA